MDSKKQFTKAEAQKILRRANTLRQKASDIACGVEDYIYDRIRAYCKLYGYDSAYDIKQPRYIDFDADVISLEIRDNYSNEWCAYKDMPTHYLWGGLEELALELEAEKEARNRKAIDAKNDADFATYQKLRERFEPDAIPQNTNV